VEHLTLQTNGVRLHVATAGEENAPLVILLHGFPEFWYGWRHQIDALAAAGFRVFAPDQRGYNLSEKPAGIPPYNIDQLAADVVGLIDAAGREKCFLVGHDWGGAVAWWTANKYPDRIEKLAILNTPHHRVFAEQVRTKPAQMLKSAYMRFLNLPWLPERVLRWGNFWLLGALIQRTAQRGTFSDADIQLYREAWAQPGALVAMLAWYRAMFQTSPLRPPSWQIEMPVLLIWGKRDLFLRWQMAQPSMALCPQGRDVVFVDDATHWIAGDAPTEVNQQLIAFFGS